MTTNEALDIIFDFIPTKILRRLKKQGLYQPILDQEANTSAKLYDYLTPVQLKLQEINYSKLAPTLIPLLNKGATLEIGCGSGDLLKRLALARFRPLYGLDRQPWLLQRAKDKLKSYKKINFYHSRLEDFDWQKLPLLKNVILNNFWELLNKDTCRNFLENLKICLDDKSLVVIGPYQNQRRTAKRIEAQRLLRTELNFTFQYPFYKKFAASGYLAKIVILNYQPYFILRRKTPFN